ncbi:MAG: citryl-CoA lyase [Acidimicrobiales bacterium]|nr:citryl-CoA lyase [Acidimicrobiales bacterium]RZV44078.1 MAG: citryl-CoA lyase [Acidimicrobiales bacterium]
MTDSQYRTGIGASDLTTIQLLGLDLADDLLGQITFGELAYWLVAKRRPTPGQRVMFEAVLVALADHGFTPTAISARMTYLSAPDSIQGAIASGLLGGGSRFLGVTEDAALFLAGALSELDSIPSSDDEWDAVALALVTQTREAGRFVPGLGHPVHKEGDPRTPVLMKMARDNDQFGPHLELFDAIGRVHSEVLGRELPLNGAGVCGAVLADIDLPLAVLRGVALLARCAGLLGHIAEEIDDPVAYDMYMHIDRNTDYRPAETS